MGFLPFFFFFFFKISVMCRGVRGAVRFWVIFSTALCSAV